jgi:hypothetical protein
MRPSRCIGCPNKTISPGPSAGSVEAPAGRLTDERLVPSIGTRPAIARIRVDLPLPEAPISATISPRARTKETSLRITFRRSKAFETRRTSKTGCTARASSPTVPANSAR